MGNREQEAEVEIVTTYLVNDVVSPEATHELFGSRDGEIFDVSRALRALPPVVQHQVRPRHRPVTPRGSGCLTSAYNRLYG